MAVTVPSANRGTPMADSRYVVGDASGVALEINPNDYVAHSGKYIIAVHDAVAYWKASGIGIAMDRNPAYDPAGRQVVNSGLLIARRGVFRVSANFSGEPNGGVLAFPDMTGSGVNAPSGATGLGSVWNTAVPVSVSGATAAAPVKAVAQVINWYGPGPTGQMDIALWDRNADYY